MASAALAVFGGHTGTQLTRTLERVVEEAQLTGELRLSGRKLKEFPKIAAKYNLVDTVFADLSKNKFSELPLEVCDYVSMERLDCYHNAIRTIPEAVICLHSLIHLNLSRNQLTTLPVTLCQLPALQVLIVSNNKLVSLPEEIGCLDQLMELDVSCNEISHLPPQIEELDNLKSLILRRNFLVDVPIEITTLPLVRLDVSSNRIATLPTHLRRLHGLMELKLDNNPLTSPPASLCTRGRIHIFKYLEIQAIKEDKKRGVLDTEYRRSNRKKLSHNNLNGIPLDSRTKRYTIDSGYNTSDGNSDRRWSQEYQDLSYELDEARRLALRAAELTKEQRLDRERSLHVRLSQLGYNHGYSSSADVLQQDGFDTFSSSASTPSALSPSGKLHAEELFNRELNRQRLNYEEKKRKAERLRHEQIDGQKEGPRLTPTRNFDELEGIRKRGENCAPTPEPQTVPNTTSTRDSIDISKPFPHIQTYREYKEVLRQQRCANSGSVYRRKPNDTEVSTTNLTESASPSPVPSLDPNQRVNVTDGALVTNQVNSLQEEFRNRHDTMMQQQQLQAQLAQRRLEEKRKQQEALISYVRTQTNLRSPTGNETTPDGYMNHQSTPPALVNGITSPLTNNGQPTVVVVDRKDPTAPSSTGKPFEPSGPHFTFRREFDKAKEEAELIRQLRSAIEARLKVVLPDDTASALMDGVVLCHLANHVRPRSVASIHVPSPAVPKLTMAKCRRNVENFLDACRRIGIAEEYICSPQDILEEKAPVRTAITVQALLQFYLPK